MVAEKQLKPVSYAPPSPYLMEIAEVMDPEHSRYEQRGTIVYHRGPSFLVHFDDMALDSHDNISITQMRVLNRETGEVMMERSHHGETIEDAPPLPLTASQKVRQVQPKPVPPPPIPEPLPVEKMKGVGKKKIATPVPKKSKKGESNSVPSSTKEDKCSCSVCQCPMTVGASEVVCNFCHVGAHQPS